MGIALLIENEVQEDQNITVMFKGCLGDQLTQYMLTTYARFNYAPEFAYNFQRDFELESGTDLIYQLPETFDRDGHQVTVFLNGSETEELPEFIKYAENNNTL